MKVEAFSPYYLGQLSALRPDSECLPVMREAALVRAHRGSLYLTIYKLRELKKLLFDREEA